MVLLSSAIPVSKLYHGLHASSQFHRVSRRRNRQPKLHRDRRTTGGDTGRYPLAELTTYAEVVQREGHEPAAAVADDRAITVERHIDIDKRVDGKYPSVYTQ